MSNKKEGFMFTNATLLIMDKNDEDLDLALALGSANYRVQTEPNNVSGAGVNASLKVDMAFAASDPLSELVWSPHKGLSLKCADSSLVDRKPFLLWNVGPSSKVLSLSQRTRSVGARDKVAIDDGIFTLSSPMPNLEAKLREKTADVVEESACIPSFIQIEDSCKKNIYVEDDDVYNIRGSEIMELGVATCSKAKATKLSKDSHVRSPMDLDDRVTSASRGSKKNMADILCSKFEASAENEFCNPIVKESRSLGEMRLPFPMNNEVCLYQEKGKEKALSEGDIYRRLANGDDDGSNQSVESCNSVGFSSRGIKRQSGDQEPIHSSKRMKNQGSHGSTSITKPHSSFMSWILNMVKGLSDSCKEESSALGLTLSCLNNGQVKNDQETFACLKTRESPNLSLGFQTMFQSLYCQDSKPPDTVAPVEHYSVQESKGLVVADNTSLKHPPKLFHGGDENVYKQIIVSNVQEDPCISSNIVGQPQPWVSSADMTGTAYAYETNLAGKKDAGRIPTCDGTAGNTAPSSPLTMSSVPPKSTSLWITRLSTKPLRLEKGNQTNQVAVERCPKYLNFIPDSRKNDDLSDDLNQSKSMGNSHEEHSSKEIQRLATDTEVNSDGRRTHKLKPTQPTPELGGSSEAMASVFARRLDALKHNISARGETNLTRSTKCFFCGKSSHNFRDCPEVAETEIEELLVKISSYDLIEESNCFCVRCFQFDHWAISCPLRLSYKHCQSEQNVSDMNPKVIVTSHSENEYKKNNGRSFPLFGMVTSKNNDAPAEMFHAIRKLRLSRLDILRWMNSHVSFTHLNGFFLRLRLGMLESGLGGTGYCVACVIADTRENSARRSKKSILVDVGGIKSSVGSRYISNDDFSEDEVKAWWCRILKTGCKIPSLDELNSRFKHRMSFGF